jgi:hypothetical protein
MKTVNEMSAADLRVALVTEGPNPWLNVRVFQGELVGDLPGVLSEGPEVVPDWPHDLEQAMNLGDILIVLGLKDAYIQNLIKVTQADTDSADGLYRLAHASARQRSEAALLSIRSRSICQTA